MNKKLSAIVDDAMARSAMLIQAIPASKVLQRANSERIAGLCKELVSTRPACDPVTPRVCELGDARYPRFPKSQTLLNAYGPLLRVWREAFQKLVSASAPMPVKGGNGLALSEADLNGLDFGTKARVVQALAALRESKLENDRLKTIIRESIPAPGHAPAAPATPQVAIGDMRAIQGWLSSLDSGGGGWRSRLSDCASRSKAGPVRSSCPRTSLRPSARSELLPSARWVGTRCRRC